MRAEPPTNKSIANMKLFINNHRLFDSAQNIINGTNSTTICGFTVDKANNTPAPLSHSILINNNVSAIKNPTKTAAFPLITGRNPWYQITPNRINNPSINGCGRQPVSAKLIAIVAIQP